ncbi:hypothetical protein V8E51_013621 [Hyaloscypha variabilis]
MSAATCVSCQEILSCGDSPLSVTGNVIGILTFAGALIISIQVYINSIRNADRRMCDMTDTLRSRVHEVQHLNDKLQGQSSCIDEDLRGRLGWAIHRVNVPLREAEDVLHRLACDRDYRKRQLLIRARFVFAEDIVREGLEKTEKAMETLKDVADDVFSEVVLEPADHEVAFRSQILQDLVEMRNEMKNLKETNAKVLNEVRDLLRDSTGQSPLRVT